jgi:hypothetical protein
MILGFKQSVQMQFFWLGNAHNQPVGAALAVRNAQGCAIAAGGRPGKLPDLRRCSFASRVWGEGGVVVSDAS